MPPRGARAASGPRADEMSGTDDDEPTSSRVNKPRAPILPSETAEGAPQRPTIPLVGRGSKRSAAAPNDDFAERPDDAPTMFDPNVPTGARGSSEDERRTNQGPAQPDPFPDIDETDQPTGATVIGKRSSVLGAAKLVGPRVPPPIDRHGRTDDSSRTNKWEAPSVLPDAEPTGPAMRPPPAPLPLPPVLPLAPGPRSEPIRVVSMKTPAGHDTDRQQRQMPEVRMRGMAEVRQNQSRTPPNGMGFLAPPRDPKEARSRRRNDYIIWGSAAVIVAAVVMLAVWFLAR